MSSNYYGSIAGEIADRGASAEAAFLEWEDAYARREPAEQLRDDFRAAFMAGYELHGTTQMEAESRRDEAIGRLAELIHDEMCSDTPSRARRAGHEQYYRDRAAVIVRTLEPEIGRANVFTAVRAIIDELW